MEKILKKKFKKVHFLDFVVQANFFIEHFPIYLPIDKSAFFIERNPKKKFFFRHAQKKVWTQENFQQKKFYLRNFSMFFSPCVSVRKKIFFFKPAYVLSKLKKKNLAAILFLRKKIFPQGGGPPTSHFLTFQNFFWISFSRRILLVKHVGVYYDS